MKLILNRNYYLAIFVTLDRLVYYNSENLTQAGNIDKIKQNIVDLLNIKDIISII